MTTDTHFGQRYLEWILENIVKWMWIVISLFYQMFYHTMLHKKTFEHTDGWRSGINNCIGFIRKQNIFLGFSGGSDVRFKFTGANPEITIYTHLSLVGKY